MGVQSWQEMLIASQVDGTALANTVTATSLLPPAARFTLPANFFGVIGKTLRITARGRISTVVTTPGSLTLDARFGTIATPIVVFNGGTMNLNVTAQANATFDFEALLTARSIGSGTAAQVIGVGSFTSRALIGSPAVAAGPPGRALLPDTAPGLGAGFDSTITNVVDLFGTWSIANASNSIQLHQFALEALN